MGQYVSQCLTCQQVRDKPGDVRFYLKNIQSGYFNELVQYDHMKICPTYDGNTGILVIINHFSKFAEAIPCCHDEYDAITTSRLLLQKWFARHGTPTRMQSDNAPNLTAEVSNEFMKASQVTKVTSTAGHPRSWTHSSDVPNGLGNKFGGTTVCAAGMWQRTSVFIAPASRRDTDSDPHDYQ